MQDKKPCNGCGEDHEPENCFHGFNTPDEQQECIYCQYIHTENEPCLEQACLCRKCGEVVLCDHKKDESHEFSLCGACAF